MNKIDYNNLKKIDGSTSIDGNYLTFYRGKLLRIVKDNKDIYNQALAFSNSIVGLIPAKMHYIDDDHLIIEHPIINNITYPLEWTYQQKLDAILVVINVQEQLMKKGFYLKDPHAFNVSFERWEPVYLDYGSIDSNRLNMIKWFLYKLMKISFYSEIGWKKTLGFSRWRIYLMVLSASIQSEDICNKLKKIIINNKNKKSINKKQKGNFWYRLKNITPPAIKRLLPPRIAQSIRLQLKIYLRIKRKIMGETQWTDYSIESSHTDIDSFRVTNFKRVLNDLHPIKMIDIGANKGFFAKFAIENGVKEVIAMDLDEPSLDLLREDARKNNLNIWTVKIDLMRFPEDISQYAYWGTFPSIDARINSDFCICFALVHHICYFGNYSFEMFAYRIQKFARKILLVEFIPYDDIHLKGPFYKGLDKRWYTQDNFISVMKKYFKASIKIYKSTPFPRTLIKFERYE